MIQLTDNLAITADQHQYILGTPRTKVVDGVETISGIKNPRYYTNMSTTLKAAVAQALKDGVANEDITTLKEFVTEQARLQNKFTAMLGILDA